MKAIVLITAFIPIFAHAEICTCKKYPFVPNPPCYNECVIKLVANSSIDLRSIEGIDPGVVVSIYALRPKEGEIAIAADFLDNTNSKQLLERKAAEKVLMRREAGLR